MVSLKNNVLVELLKVPVDKLFPFFIKATWLIPSVGFPVPESPKVNPVILTGVVPGLVSITCRTATFTAPGNWIELEGVAGPVDTKTVTVVGVEVMVAVFVTVFVVVVVNVFEAVEDEV
jgi:hypothetical protein